MRTSVPNERRAGGGGDEFEGRGDDDDAQQEPRPAAQVRGAVGELRDPAASADEEAGEDAGGHLHVEGGVAVQARAASCSSRRRCAPSRARRRERSRGRRRCRSSARSPGTRRRRWSPSRTRTAAAARQFRGRRVEQAQREQHEHAAVRHVAQRQQGEAEHRVDDQHVAGPEQHGVDPADGEQGGESPQVEAGRRAPAGPPAAGVRAPRRRSCKVKPMPNSRPNRRLNLPAKSASRRAATRRSSAPRSAAGGANSECVKPGMFIMKMPSKRHAAQNVEGDDALAGAHGGCRNGPGDVGVSAHAATVSQVGSPLGPPDRAGIRTLITGDRPCSRPPSQAACPSPRGSPRPRSSGRNGSRAAPSSQRAKADATLLWLKVQEDAGLDIVGDGEQSRQHFVHGFLERVERHRLRAQGEDGHPQQPLRRDGAAGGRAAPPAGPRPRDRGAAAARAHAAAAEVHLAGPDDHRRHRRRPPLRQTALAKHGDGVFAELLNQEARALRGRRRRHRPVRRAGVQRLHGRRRRLGRRPRSERAAEGPARARRPCTSATATASRPTSTGRRRSASEWRQYEQVFPALARELDRPGLARVLPLARAARAHAAARRQGRDGRRDRRRHRDEVETPEAGRRHHRHGAAASCRRERLLPCTNCGLAPMRREIAEAKLAALAAGRGPGAARGSAHDGSSGRTDRRLRTGCDRPRSDRGRAVLSPAGFATFAGTGLAELDALRATWDDLPPDAHLRDGGRYRKRRHASFVVDAGEVRLVPQRAHWQPVEYNALHGGLERWFEPIAAERRSRRRPGARMLRRIRGAGVAAEGRAAVVRRGAPVPHRHDRRHRPADAGRRAPRRRRLRRRGAGGARGDQGRRDARLRRRGPERHALHAARAVEHAASSTTRA